MKFLRFTLNYSRWEHFHYFSWLLYNYWRSLYAVHTCTYEHLINHFSVISKFLCIHCTTANKSFFYLLVEVAILWFKQSVYSTYVYVEVFSQSFLYYIRAAWFVRIKYNVMYDGSWFQLFYFLSKFFTIIIQVFFYFTEIWTTTIYYLAKLM